ncbi:MAG TPA: FHA domain-containing protein [Candidatus Limnocylindrales bacterium]|nr:FHA domain-containing protein [Candidatus Limnocylindrales bacterium]
MMQPTDKLSLVRSVKHYEEQVQASATAQFRPTSTIVPSLFDDDDEQNTGAMDDLAALMANAGDTTVKLPVSLRKRTEAAAVPAAPEPESKSEPEHVAGETLACPNCGNPVLSSVLQCPTCYFVMPAAGEPVELPDPVLEPVMPEATYGSSTTLVLTARDGRRLHSRPQDRNRETIVGRTDGKTFTADLDLSPLGAADLGVSRVHAALAFNPERGTLTVSDMNSMNGTFLNGLRLQPQEVHELRPGDHLRLGRLSMRVTYEER